MTITLIWSLSFLTICVRIIDNSALRAELFIFTMSVWLEMKTCSVYLAITGPITSPHESISLRCSKGVSSPEALRNLTNTSSRAFTSRRNMFCYCFR